MSTTTAYPKNTSSSYTKSLAFFASDSISRSMLEAASDYTEYVQDVITDLINDSDKKCTWLRYPDSEKAIETWNKLMLSNSLYDHMVIAPGGYTLKTFVDTLYQMASEKRGQAIKNLFDQYGEFLHVKGSDLKNMDDARLEFFASLLKDGDRTTKFLKLSHLIPTDTEKAIATEVVVEATEVPAQQPAADATKIFDMGVLTGSTPIHPMVFGDIAANMGLSADEQKIFMEASIAAQASVANRGWGNIVKPEHVDPIVYVEGKEPPQPLDYVPVDRNNLAPLDGPRIANLPAANVTPASNPEPPVVEQRVADLSTDPDPLYDHWSNMEIVFPNDKIKKYFKHNPKMVAIIQRRFNQIIDAAVAANVRDLVSNKLTVKVANGPSQMEFIGSVGTNQMTLLIGSKEGRIKFGKKDLVVVGLAPFSK